MFNIRILLFLIDQTSLFIEKIFVSQMAELKEFVLFCENVDSILEDGDPGFIESGLEIISPSYTCKFFMKILSLQTMNAPIRKSVTYLNYLEKTQIFRRILCFPS